MMVAGPADRLFRRIAGQALGTGIPGQNLAFGIQHEDRVILDRVDQQAETRLAVAHASLAGAALGQIMDHPDKDTGLVLAVFADRQLEGKHAAVLAAPQHLAADADDALLAGAAITVQVTVMLAAIDRKSTRLNSSHYCASRM